MKNLVDGLINVGLVLFFGTPLLIATGVLGGLS